MGTLFPNDDEYPDYLPLPRLTARLGSNGAIVPLAIAGTLFGLCPILLEEHGHPIHEDHQPIDHRAPVIAVSTSSSGNITLTPSSGSADLTGYSPTIMNARWIKQL